MMKFDKYAKKLVMVVIFLLLFGSVMVFSTCLLYTSIVKDSFKNLAKGCTCPKELYVCVCNNKPKIKILTRKPLIPSKDEMDKNSRSKSSKLRVCSKI